MATSSFQTESFALSRHRPARDWPRRIAFLNDYVRIPYANGSSFASQLLYREFSKRGHDVVVIGPTDPEAKPADLPRLHLSLPSLPLRNHPGVRLALPSPAALAQLERNPPDVVLGQTCSGLLELGVWMRQRLGVPFLCVNTVHLPSVYNVLLPDRLLQSDAVRSLFSDRLIPWAEQRTAHAYDRSDGLVVLSSGLSSYWRARGVGAPIFVIPRCIEPGLFDVPASTDPYPEWAQRGRRLLVVCRHSREKGVERLLEIFARWVAPAVAGATLTLVGDGPDHDAFRAKAIELGVAERTLFVGEQSAAEVAGWYQHADVFVYASLSETYGQVVSEALWSGLPTVAFEDGMGVSQQIDGGLNGLLVPPGPDATAADWRFAVEVAGLLRDPAKRRALGSVAQRLARERSDIGASIERYYAAFEAARARVRRAPRLSPREANEALGRWTALHAALAALGTIRKPAVVNRNGRRQSGWDEALGPP
jgi:glycosyltransferase involved in cell wall biosynthesis